MVKLYHFNNHIIKDCSTVAIEESTLKYELQYSLIYRYLYIKIHLYRTRIYLFDVRLFFTTSSRLLKICSTKLIFLIS